MDDKVPRRKKKSLKKILKHKILRMRNIFVAIALIISIILSISIISLKIFPITYVMIFLGISVALNLIGIIFINVHKMTILKVVGGLFIAVTIVTTITGLFLTRSTSNFINNTFKEDSHLYHQNTYYLLGFNDSTTVNSELTGLYGIYENMYNITGAIEKLDKKYTLTKKEYADIYEMFMAMSEGQINYILMEKTAYESLFMLNSDLNKNDYKIIYEYDVYSKNNKTYSENKDKYNVLIRTINEFGICNNNFVLTVDMINDKILAISIPQDEYIYIKDLNRNEKIKYIDIYGKDKINDWIEEAFDIDIDYTINLDEKEFAKFVDHVDGIKFCSKNKIELSDTEKIEDGCQIIEGEQLKAIISYEFYNEKGKIFGSILENLYDKSLSTLKITNYSETLSYLSKSFETNIPKDVGIKVIENIINKDAKWDIETVTLSGEKMYYPVLTSYTNDYVQVSTSKDINIIKDKINEALN